MRHALLLMTFAALADPVTAGVRADYMLHCGGCHLPDGRGAPPKVPDLRNELGWLATTQQGRNYLVRVPGASQAPVTDAQLAAIVNWLLVEYNADELPADFEPLTEPEVAAARKRVLSDPLKARRELWQAYR